MAKPVEVFCRALSMELSSWGSIEPEVFENIAEGLTGEASEDPPDGYYANKYSQEEMKSAVEGMRFAIEQALARVGVK